MRTFLIIIIIFLSGHAMAQQEVITRYTDSSRRDAPRSEAYYRYDFRKNGNVYNVVSYYVSSGKVAGRATYGDTLFRKGIGAAVSYDENGMVIDSALHDAQGAIVNEYFFKNGKLSVRTNWNKAANTKTFYEYDANGKVIPSATVLQTLPDFKEGGIAGWVEHLQNNLRKDIPARKGAPVGIYTVTVEFWIAEDGKVVDVRALNDPGYGSAEEAVRLISRSPKWIPSKRNGTGVRYRHLQNITFQVTEK